jgi:UDP-N-acetylmuramoyl-tripeptide--D-alanyl-D-alanine ligase
LPTAEDAGRWLEKNLRPGDVVLVKGSRGVRLERAIALVSGSAQSSSARL